MSTLELELHGYLRSTALAVAVARVTGEKTKAGMMLVVLMPLKRPLKYQMSGGSPPNKAQLLYRFASASIFSVPAVGNSHSWFALPAHRT